MFSTFIRPFVLICLLRSEPQQLPRSSLLLVMALVSYMALGALLATVYVGIYRGLLAAGIDTLLLSILTFSVLLPLRRTERLLQTLSALAGCGAIIGIIGYLFTWLISIPTDGEAPGIGSLLLVAVAIWNITVAAHILRHALSAPFFVGLIVSIVFYLLSLQIFNNLYFWILKIA